MPTRYVAPSAVSSWEEITTPQSPTHPTPYPPQKALHQTRLPLKEGRMSTPQSTTRTSKHTPYQTSPSSRFRRSYRTLIPNGPNASQRPMELLILLEYWHRQQLWCPQLKHLPPRLLQHKPVRLSCWRHQRRCPSRVIRVVADSRWCHSCRRVRSLIRSKLIRRAPLVLGMIRVRARGVSWLGVSNLMVLALLRGILIRVA